MKWRALLDVPVLPVLLVGIAVGLVGLTVVSEQPTVVGGPNLGSGRGSGLSQAPRSVQEFVPVRGPAGPVATVRDQTMALRQLVIATGPEDLRLATWKAALDRIGTPYDVLYARSGVFTRSPLVRSDGAGRYNAVLLTSTALLVPDGKGRYTSAFGPSDWSTLWDYQRRHHVRQVSLNSGGGTYPEETCLREVSEGATGVASAPIRLTATGAAVFDYLRPDASLPSVDSYVYRTALAPGCDVTPWLTLDGDVVGAVSSRDGRERAALTFSPTAGQPLEELLGFGLLRWATRGVFLGEQRHWLAVDVDDWFNSNTHVAPKAGQQDPDQDAKNAKVFRMTGAEALAISQAQQTLGERYPVAAGFRLNLAYNGGNINPQAPAQCSSQNTPDPLTSYSRCLREKFRWINHTLTHPSLDDTSYERTYEEITQNLAAAAEIGLPVPTDVLKTPAYSGLGIRQGVSAEVSADGVAGDLRGSNPNLLKAAGELGIRYLHGDLSFPGHRPDCFNCGKVIPTQPGLLLVPDWPTDILWQAIDPVEETAGYNLTDGRGGSIGEPGGADRTYAQILDAEAEETLQHIMQGSAYVHTLHQTNLHVYAPGHSLAFDWINAVVAKYSAYYRVPLTNPDWNTLAAYVRGRTEHFAAVKHGPDALWNRVTNVITYAAGAGGTLFVTGLATRRAGTSGQGGTDAADYYGTDPVSRVGTVAGTEVSYIASPRP